jgi:hypothetical protein
MTHLQTNIKRRVRCLPNVGVILMNLKKIAKIFIANRLQCAYK